jgi:hypothetical protein
MGDPLISRKALPERPPHRDAAALCVPHHVVRPGTAWERDAAVRASLGHLFVPHRLGRLAPHAGVTARDKGSRRRWTGRSLAPLSERLPAPLRVSNQP